MTRFDRRALFATGAAAALLAATGVTLAGPKRGGRLRIAVPRTDSGLHPIARAAVFETLTELTPEGILRGRLATGWRPSSDSQTWEFDLRPQIMRHDGRALDIAEVARSLERSLGAVVQAGGTTVRIHLDTPDAQLPIHLASLEHEVRSGDAESPGTGLYAMRQELPGGGLVAVRVAQHPLAELAGWAESLEIAVFSDPKVRAQALNEGLVDIAIEPDVSALDPAAGFNLLPTDTEPAMALASTVGVPDWRDYPDLRLAERVWLT